MAIGKHRNNGTDSTLRAPPYPRAVVGTMATYAFNVGLTGVHWYRT